MTKSNKNTGSNKKAASNKRKPTQAKKPKSVESKSHSSTPIKAKAKTTAKAQSKKSVDKGKPKDPRILEAEIKLKKIIGDNLGRVRKSRNLTQEQLSEKVGKAVETISNIERGFAFTGLATLLQFSKALDVSILYFFDERNLIPESAKGHELPLKDIQALMTKLNEKDLAIAKDLIYSLHIHSS